MTDKPTIDELWKQANGDGKKYLALMLEHGYVRLRKTADPLFDLDTPILPCGLTPRMIRTFASGTGGRLRSNRTDGLVPERQTP